MGRWRRRAAVGGGVAHHLVVVLAPDHAGVPAEHLVADPLAGQHGDLPGACGLLEGLQQPGPHERIQGLLAASGVAVHRLHQGRGREPAPVDRLLVPLMVAPWWAAGWHGYRSGPPGARSTGGWSRPARTLR